MAESAEQGPQFCRNFVKLRPANRARRPADEMPPKAKPKPKPKQTPKAPYPGFKPEDKKKQNGPGHNEVKKAVVNGEAPGDRW